MLDRTDSPWYPTARLYRQSTFGDWSGPVERLRRDLAEMGKGTVDEWSRNAGRAS